MDGVNWDEDIRLEKTSDTNIVLKYDIVKRQIVGAIVGNTHLEKSEFSERVWDMVEEYTHRLRHEGGQNG